MNLLTIVSAAALFGIDFGWEPVAGGGVRYIIQIPPEQVDDWKSGKLDISNDLPPTEGGVRSIRYVIGNDRLPHQGETPPKALLQAAPSNGGSAPRTNVTLSPENPAPGNSNQPTNPAGGSTPGASSAPSTFSVYAPSNAPSAAGSSANAPGTNAPGNVPPILPTTPIPEAEHHHPSLNYSTPPSGYAPNTIQPVAGASPMPTAAVPSNAAPTNPLTGAPLGAPATSNATSNPWPPTSPLVPPAASTYPSNTPGATPPYGALPPTMGAATSSGAASATGSTYTPPSSPYGNAPATTNPVGVSVSPAYTAPANSTAPTTNYNDPRYGGQTNNNPPSYSTPNNNAAVNDYNATPHVITNSALPSTNAAIPWSTPNANNPAYTATPSQPAATMAAAPGPLLRRPTNDGTATNVGTVAQGATETYRSAAATSQTQFTPEPIQHWLPLMLSLVALFLSIGANAYLITVAWTQRERYDALAEMLTGDRRSSLGSSALAP